jgi:hypothetical protein
MMLKGLNARCQGLWFDDGGNDEMLDERNGGDGRDRRAPALDGLVANPCISESILDFDSTDAASVVELTDTKSMRNSAGLVCWGHEKPSVLKYEIASSRGP